MQSPFIYIFVQYVFVCLFVILYPDCMRFYNINFA